MPCNIYILFKPMCQWMAISIFPPPWFSLWRATYQWPNKPATSQWTMCHVYRFSDTCQKRLCIQMPLSNHCTLHGWCSTNFVIYKLSRRDIKHKTSPSSLSTHTQHIHTMQRQRKATLMLALFAVMCALFMGIQTASAADDKEAYGTGK